MNYTEINTQTARTFAMKKVVNYLTNNKMLVIDQSE